MSRLFDYYKPTQGIYIHIPHCLQKCHYCDFSTVLLDQGPDLDLYTNLIEQELELCLLKEKEISSIYFGGGTPSLLGPKRIDQIINKIFRLGYTLAPENEITVEINPNTLSLKDIIDLKNAGVNRFSVGVQTFKDQTLKVIGREHTAQDSLETLSLLKKAQVDFTADLILALPGEDYSIFKSNAEKLIPFEPHHMSVYVLTVPEKSFLSQLMPKDDLLDELMDRSEEFLLSHDYERYEISNYRKKNLRPSLHNLLYWNDCNYWGVGMGAHSYFKDESQWGTRFWNPRTFESYQAQLRLRTPGDKFPPSKQQEALQLNESLTDFCFTHLRQWEGISKTTLELKYPEKIKTTVIEKLQLLQKEGYIEGNHVEWRLSKHGRKFADHVFRELCFTKTDLEK